jgi:hypothetical protein
MRRNLNGFATASALVIAAAGGSAAFAQKPGGTLRVQQWDNPPSLSIHEEVTLATGCR